MRLFIDIETVPNWEVVTDNTNSERKKKFLALCRKKLNKVQYPEQYNNDYEVQRIGALSPELGDIICICLGIEDYKNNVFKIKKLIGVEKDILVDVVTIINSIATKKNIQFISHAGLHFDYPFIVKKLIKYNIDVPTDLYEIVSAKYPPNYICDTQEYWRMRNFNDKPSLDLLCYYFDVESPKNGEITGSTVFDEYMKGNIYGIAEYCANDVYALYQIYHKIIRSQEVILPMSVSPQF